MGTRLLANVTDKDVSRSPFAHIVIEDALDQVLYEKLASAFPPPERFLRGIVPDNNQAIRIPARDIIDNPEFSPEWQDFFRYHTSRDYWLEILRVAGPAIRDAHPGLEKMVGKKFEDWTVKVRGTEGEADVALDALFVINTPVQKKSSVRPAHVDARDEIYAGLLYMKPEGDDTVGGDLSLYRFKDEPQFGGHYAELGDIVEEGQVRYGANRYVGFVNSAASIHGVSPREVTERYRRYINMVAITPFNAFDLPRMSVRKQLKFWLKRRKTKSHGIQAKAEM